MSSDRELSAMMDDVGGEAVLGRRLPPAVVAFQPEGHCGSLGG